MDDCTFPEPEAILQEHTPAAAIDVPQPGEDEAANLEEQTPAATIDVPKKEDVDKDVGVDVDEDDTSWILTQDLWTDVEAINGHASAKHKVRTGGISMTFIPAEGQGKKVKQARTRAPARDDEDTNDQLLAILLATVANLAARVNDLEGQLPAVQSAASSSTLAATSSTGQWSKKRCVHSAQLYGVPRHDPWPMNSGKCPKCSHHWSTWDSPENFSTDRHTWESAMTKMFAAWSPGTIQKVQKTDEVPHNQHINRVADKPVQKQRQVSRELEDCRHAQFEVEEEGLSSNLKVRNKAVRQNASAALQNVHGSPHVDILHMAAPRKAWQDHQDD